MSYPQSIVITRHAEKPEDPEDINLSGAGLARARALVTFIPDRFGNPAFLFAAAKSHHSRRSIETLEPLAQDLGLAINSNFADQQYEALSEELLSGEQYKGQFIL